MPVIKSAKKKLKQDKKRFLKNSLLRKKLKEILKKAEKNPTQALLIEAVKTTDKAAKNNIIHKNKAAHIKSKLSKLENPAPKAESKKTTTTKKPTKPRKK